MRHILIIFFLFLLLLLPVLFTSAQTSLNDFTINMYPETPAPSSLVTVTIDSIAFDINQASIAWSVDGKQELAGIGERVLKLKAGPSGSKTIVDVLVNIGGLRLIKRAVIVPASTDLLWEAIDTYTPPFYKGKALPAQEADIKLVAIPDVISSGTRLKPNEFDYEWRKNGNVESSGFGFNKSYFVFRNNYLNKNEEVGVFAKSRGGAKGSGGALIAIVAPKILFYEEGGSLYQKALTSLELTKETILVAEPYFIFPRNLLSSDLILDWKINDVKTTTTQKNKIILGPTQSVGASSISLDIKNKSRLLFSVDKKLEVLVKNK